MSKVSDEFYNAFDYHIVSSMAECQCGKTHVDLVSPEWDWEEGELDNLSSQAAEKNSSLTVRSTPIRRYNINDKLFVLGCNCKEGIAYEQFILNNAAGIAAYLNSVSADMVRKAKNMEIHKKVIDIIDSL